MDHGFGVKYKNSLPNSSGEFYPLALISLGQGLLQGVLTPSHLQVCAWRCWHDHAGSHRQGGRGALGRKEESGSTAGGGTVGLQRAQVGPVTAGAKRWPESTWERAQKLSGEKNAIWGEISHYWDFPGGPVAKHPPCNAGDMGSIPGWGTRIPCAMEQLSLRALGPAWHNWRVCVSQRKILMTWQRS